MRLTDFFSHGESADESTSDICPMESQPPILLMAEPPNDTRGVDDSTPDMRPEPSQRSLPLTAQPRKGNSLKRGPVVQTPHHSPDHLTEVSGDVARTDSIQSSTTSPLKHRAKLDTATEGEGDVIPPVEDTLDKFPTSDQAVSQSVLKDMMLALRSSIQQSLNTALSSHQTAIDDLGGRVDHVESKMAEFSEAHNDLVDAHNTMEDELQRLTTKLADIEDRHRRNNIKIRGIPESISGPELVPYIQQMMASIIKSASKRDLILDRAHRLPKPNSVPATAPRDVILRVHFYHIKEALMRIARDTSTLPEPYHKLKLYADLSQHTIQARRKLQPVTAALRQHQVPYRWGFPTKLLIMKNGTTHVITTVADGAPVLRTLGVPFSLPSSSGHARHASKMPSEWTTVR